MARLLFTARQFGSLADPINQKTNTELADLIGKPVQFMHQTHSNNLHLISTIETAKEDTDSLITDNKDLALAVRVADCLEFMRLRIGVLQSRSRWCLDDAVDDPLIFQRNES